MAQAQCFIWDKKSLYSTNTRNQYIQPPYKDAINTKKFLQGIKDGKYWCLNSNEVNGLKVCADPPKKYDLAQILGDVMLTYRFMGEPTDTNFRRTGFWSNRSLLIWIGNWRFYRRSCQPTRSSIKITVALATKTALLWWYAIRTATLMACQSCPRPASV